MKDFTGLQLVGVIAGFIFVFALLIFVYAWVTSVLWNYVMPTIFGLPTISIEQAFVLGVLTRMLFTSYSYSRSSK